MNISEEIAGWFTANDFNRQAPQATNGKGQHALIISAQQARPDVLAYLLDNGADLSVLDLYGNNALWAACFAESNDCIALLISAGINVDYQNPSGATALTYASSSGKHTVVAQLLQAGANPLLTTQDDFSALDLAANRACLQLLRQATRALKV
ncbi:MAG: ankyrin repeat domain-containing protein [Methylomonas sp.]|jgi:thiosulfate/3-mercaptopyruvate sulfurtransferase|uniref:ankyrin repeat domain-containing protein n=1 Tax=Methylomonas sp. TaxID=418 RepID=UPI0025F30328|nr:ankyrin repeat domain-containing protein [Methylomonas sp.]MCK9608902.1 ankyrin repeat domain-containing protein [Methylomonas sp.]